MKLITTDSVTISPDAILIYLVSETLQKFHDMYRFAILCSTNQKIRLSVRKVDEKRQQIQGYRAIAFPKKAEYGLLRFDRGSRNHLDECRCFPCEITQKYNEWDCVISAPFLREDVWRPNEQAQDLLRAS